MDVPFFNRITSHKPYVTWYTPGVYFGKRTREAENFFRVIAPDGDAYPQIDPEHLLYLLA